MSKSLAELIEEESSHGAGHTPPADSGNPGGRPAAKAARGSGRRGRSNRPAATKSNPPGKSAGRAGAVAKLEPVSLDETRRFCHAMLFETGFNATDAYLQIRPGVKRSTAGANGHRLLKRAETQATLAKMRDDLAEQHDLEASFIVGRWFEMAHANIMDYWGFDPESGVLVLKDPTALPEAVQRNITQLEVTTDRVETSEGESAVLRQRVKLRIVDRKGVLDSMARAAGLFGESEEDTGSVARAIEEGFSRVQAAMGGGKTLEGEFAEAVDAELVD